MINLTLHYWSLLNLHQLNHHLNSILRDIRKAPLTPFPEHLRSGWALENVGESWGGPSEASFETSEIVRNGAASSRRNGFQKPRWLTGWFLLVRQLIYHVDSVDI